MNLITATCPCGATFTTTVARQAKGRGRYCSQACMYQHRSMPKRSHGLRDHPLYVTHAGMVARCTNPGTPAYALYGARGIRVCEEWLDVATFIRDVERDLGPRPDGYSLDRIDNDGNYEPGNIRWADRFTQAQNIRSHADSTSRYLGVSRTPDGRWRAQVVRDGVYKHLGRYATEEEAHRAYEEEREPTMSKETLTWLNHNVLVGFADKRGRAWHYEETAQGDEPNHYPGAIPVEDVKRRLFHWSAIEAQVEASYNEITVDGVTTHRIIDDQHKAIIHPVTGKVLGVHGSTYKIHQYTDWLLDNVATILDDDLGIGSAGLLQGGAKAWVSVEVPENIVTPEGVAFRPHLLACTAHDGSLATTYKRVVTNVVCDNTMAAGLAEDGQQYRIRHSSRSLTRIAEVRDALNIVHSIGDAFAAEVAALSAIKVSNNAWNAFIEAHVPTKDIKRGRGLTLAQNKQAALRNLYATDPRVAPWAGTGWGVLQAVNTYEHHVASFKGDSREDRNRLKAVTGEWDKVDVVTVNTLQRVLATV